MPLLHFQSRFAQLVANGTKRQTIRVERKRPISAGEKLIFCQWIGKPYRSKVARLGDATCKSVEPIVIVDRHTVNVNGKHLSGKAKYALAKADGFEHWFDMVDWFEHIHGLPFRGVVIKW